MKRYRSLKKVVELLRSYYGSSICKVRPITLSLSFSIQPFIKSALTIENGLYYLLFPTVLSLTNKLLSFV